MARIVSRQAIEPRVHTPPPPGSWGEEYRTGVWQPNSEEIVAEDLQVIQGSIPHDISGRYIRNTENPIHDTMDGNVNYHPFDGDGMLHMIRFKDGKAKYCNKWTRTKAFAAEQKAGRSLWVGLLEYKKSGKRSELPGWGDGLGKFFALKDTASTDVVVHAGRVLPSWYLCGEPYAVSLDTLETVGISAWAPKEGVSAHHKVDEATGELMFFNYGLDRQMKPFINYGVVDRNSHLTNYQHLSLTPDSMAGFAMPHDMCVSKNYSIINYFLKDNANWGIIPRHGSASQVRWFKSSPTYSLHQLNAYEDGDDVVMDGYHMANPKIFTKLGSPDSLDLTIAHPRLWRWRFNMKTGETAETCLDPQEQVREFGMFNQQYQGRDYKYAYSAIPDKGGFRFTGVSKHDVKTGQSWSHNLDPGIYGSESPVAPKVGGKDEDDAYLVSFLMDMNKDRSLCVLLDAKRIQDGPVCTILLPHRISSGTHACWADDAATAVVTLPQSCSKL